MEHKRTASTSIPGFVLNTLGLVVPVLDKLGMSLIPRETPGFLVPNVGKFLPLEIGGPATVQIPIGPFYLKQNNSKKQSIEISLEPKSLNCLNITGEFGNSIFGSYW